MDAVYILGTGSHANNEEIRYSVRSLEKHMLDLGTVYVVGEKPECLPRAEHVAATDPTPDKWKNAFSKTRKACEIEALSEDFLLMNDDFFMLEPFFGAEWPTYALKGSNGGACGIHSFHVHCPIRLNKKLYASMPYDPNGKACRSPRSFYANFYRCPPTMTDDFILRAAAVCRPFDEQAAGRPCISVNDGAMLDEPFRTWLHSRLPEPSRFE